VNIVSQQNLYSQLWKVIIMNIMMTPVRKTRDEKVFRERFRSIMLSVAAKRQK